MPIFHPTTLTDALLITPKVIGDERGFFCETYSLRDFCQGGIVANFVQSNHSKSAKGVLRGLHFQTNHPQAKLVRVVRGSVYDVIVDLRLGSPTYGSWQGFLLSSENKAQLFVPRGFAHGFLTLEDGTEFLYDCDDYYDPQGEESILWNDRALSIDWSEWMSRYGIEQPQLSQRDHQGKNLDSILSQNYFSFVGTIS